MIAPVQNAIDASTGGQPCGSRLVPHVQAAATGATCAPPARTLARSSAYSPFLPAARRCANEAENVGSACEARWLKSQGRQNSEVSANRPLLRILAQSHIFGKTIHNIRHCDTPRQQILAISIFQAPPAAADATCHSRSRRAMNVCGYAGRDNVRAAPNSGEHRRSHRWLARMLVRRVGPWPPTLCRDGRAGDGEPIWPR